MVRPTVSNSRNRIVLYLVIGASVVLVLWYVLLFVRFDGTSSHHRDLPDQRVAALFDRDPFAQHDKALHRHAQEKEEANDSQQSPAGSTAKSSSSKQRRGSSSSKHSSRNGGPKNVFFDLGANIGDSLTSFVGDKAAMGGESITGKGKVGQWDLWGFEANPHFTPMLQALEQKLNEVRLPNGEKQYTVFMKPQSAITTRNEKVTFYLDTVNKKYNYWGSSLLDTHGDVIRSGQTKVMVDGYSLSDLILDNYDMDDYIIVKMDIEGSEYQILNDLLLTGAIHYIDVLVCEFHPHLAPVRGMEQTLQYQLKLAGVKLGEWV